MPTDLGALADEAVRPFDAVQITQAAAATGAQGWRSRLPVLPRGWRAVLMLALLAVSLVGIGIVGGFIRLPNNDLVPNPTFQPFSPLPTALVSPGLPTGSPDGSGQPTFLPATASPSTDPATLSPTPTVTASPSPTAQPTPSPSPTAQPSPTPSPTIAPVSAVTAIADGDTHSCALADDGRVFCWGYNDMGQLGDGTHDYRDYGTLPVVGIDDAVAISAGIRYSCAVRADGSVWCWGEDLMTDGDSPVPVQVAGISDATRVTAGGAFACALRRGGEVACWGNNELGQVGNGSIGGQVAGPSNVVGLGDAVQISSGWNHTCAVRSDGSCLVLGRQRRRRHRLRPAGRWHV